MRGRSRRGVLRPARGYHVLALTAAGQVMRMMQGVRGMRMQSL
jgi:hypothetical protein